MDDDVDFFTRKPLPNRSKSKPKAKVPPKVANGSAANGVTQPISSATVASSSQSAATAQRVGDEDGSDVEIDVDALEDEDDDDDDDEDEDTVLWSSDMDVASDDSDASAKRRAKRRKKKHAKTLPAWASQGIYRRPSQEPTSSASNPVFVDTSSGVHAEGVKSSQLGSDETADTENTPASKANGRPRRVSLTPPPPPSPEKLYMARELVNRTMASKFGISASATTSASTAPGLSSSNDSASGSHRTTRSTRNSATPAFGQDAPTDGSSTLLSPTSAARRSGGFGDDDDDDDALEQVHWDPDLARLMRGENAKHIREQARREQQEREAKRKQRELERIRQQPSSLPGSSSQRSAQFGRTQSAPQTTATQARASATNGGGGGGDESDDSVEFVARPARKTSTSPRRTRSSIATAAASQSSNGAIIVIDDDDDDDDAQPASKAHGSVATQHAPSPSPPPAQDAAGETLSLTLQSKLGSIPVAVTPATLLSRIIQHFHDKKLDSSVKVEAVRVMFDGFAYKPSQTVGEMDVEDGDQIELSWA